MAGGWGLLLIAVVFAQRQPSTVYDIDRQVKLQGPVTRVEWVNPHAFLFVNVRDAEGSVTNWAVEFGEPLELERQGWKANTVRIGDVVAIDANPARGSAKQARAIAVSLAPSGKRLFTAPATTQSASGTREPAPRWPGGHVRLGPAPGRKGYWGPAKANALVESTGPAIPMTSEGLLLNLADASRVAPFQPWAKALYEYRQRRLLQDDPQRRCIPPGGPRQFEAANGFQFVEQPDVGRVLVLLGGGDRNWRMIYTDGRPQGEAAEVVRGYYGNSVGRWEGDTLVVDSIGYNESFWFTNGGLPHTEALHLVERFSRPDLRTLRYEVTVDDPRTFTRTWKGGWTHDWVPDADMQEYFCEENAESTLR